jgi:hypothetical protein
MDPSLGERGRSADLVEEQQPLADDRGDLELEAGLLRHRRDDLFGAPGAGWNRVRVPTIGGGPGATNRTSTTRVRRS